MDIKQRSGSTIESFTCHCRDLNVIENEMEALNSELCNSQLNDLLAAKIRIDYREKR